MIYRASGRASQAILVNDMYDSDGANVNATTGEQRLANNDWRLPVCDAVSNHQICHTVREFEDYQEKPEEAASWKFFVLSFKG